MPTGGEDVRKRKDGRWEGRLLSPGGKRQSVDAKTQGKVQKKQKAKSALSRAGGRWENKDGLTGCRCNCRRGMLSVQHPAPDYRFAAFIFCVRHNIEGALDAPRQTVGFRGGRIAPARSSARLFTSVPLPWPAAPPKAAARLKARRRRTFSVRPAPRPRRSKTDGAAF